MGTRALVLGGGGTVGIAWETGIAAGLLEAGIRLADADLVVGTSAGSVVGAWLTSGADAGRLLALQLQEPGTADRPSTGADLAGLQAIFTKWVETGGLTRESRQAIGAMALAVATAPEARWVGYFERLLGATAWPEQPLLVTAVSAETGAFVTWDRHSDVPLHAAVASSCTVPGLFPPVTINGGRYVDGGVRSGTNADLARGYDSVVIVAPMSAGQQSLARLRHWESEMAELKAGGSRVELVQPDAEALQAFGPNMMDAGRRAEAATAGLRQGREAAERIRAIWS